MTQRAVSHCKKVVPLIDLLNQLKPPHRKVLLSYLNDNGFALVQSCIFNAINNEALPAREKLRKNLEKDKKMWRYLSRGKLTKAKKKKIVQSGDGFGLGAILSVVLPMAISYLSKKLKKK